MQKCCAEQSAVILDGKNVEATPQQLKDLTPGIMRCAAGVFTTILVQDGVPVFLKEHITRLCLGMENLRISSPESRFQLTELAKEFVHGQTTARLRIMVWREDRKTRFALVVVPYAPPSPQIYAEGMKALWSQTSVNEKGVASQVKSLDYRFYFAAYKEAVEQGFDEALLVNSRGEIAEASRANVFFVKDGLLMTPDLASGCLAGIMRREVFRLARSARVSLKSLRVLPAELESADEAFLTNSLIGIMPLVQVGQKKIGDGRPGAVTRQLMSAYAAILSDTKDASGQNEFRAVC